MPDLKNSRPLSGNLFSLHTDEDGEFLDGSEFSSPSGESIFSTKKEELLCSKNYSRPLSGNLFSLFKTSLHFGNPITNSRPLSGNLFSL